jgi:hypothetical protein
MTPLQEARAKWLDAESRLIRELEENARLRARVFELESRLIITTGQLSIANMQSAMFLPFVFAGKPNTTDTEAKP